MNRRLSMVTAAVTVGALLHVSTPAYCARPRRPGSRPERAGEGGRRQGSAPDFLAGAGTPEVALQFRPCLPDEQRRKVVSSVKKALKAAGTGETDVRSRCSSENFLEGTETMGIWREAPAYPSQDPLTSATRDGGLARVALLQGGEQFASRISYALLTSLSNQAWESMDKRLDEQGRPDPHGDIHLRSFSFAFADGNKVRTRVGGAYHYGPIIPDFVFRMVDTISIPGGVPQADSTQSLDVDETPVTLIMVGLTAFFPPLGALGLKGLVKVWEKEADPPDPGTNVGAMVLQMLPPQLMVSNGQKVVFNYQRLRLAPNEPVTAGGTLSVVARDPHVTIEGPRDVWTLRGDRPHHVVYKASTRDLRPRLSAAWTLDGRPTDPPPAPGARLSRPLPDLDPATEGVSFDVPRIATGSSETHRVEVVVTDADVLVARAGIDVRVHVDDPRHPAICREKPSLPQCRHDARR